MPRRLMLLLALASLAALTACATGGGPAAADQPQMLSIKGSLTYRARVALPPETVAIMELKDASAANGGVVSEQRMDLRGKQVPIPFEMDVDRAKLVDGRQYSVRAAFQLHGRPTWVSDPVAIAPQAGTIDVGVLDMKPYTALAFASDLKCGDRTVTVGFVADVMRLTTGDRSFDMRPATSASGSTYEAVDDPSTTLSTKGSEATVVVKGVAYPPCIKGTGTPAPFRATGNEPGWRLDIGETEMTFLASNGQKRVVTPTPAAKKSEGARKYVTKSGGHDLTVTVVDRLCSDTMTGMPHPNTVVVVFEGKTLNGCGGDPASLLRGGEWVVEDITGVRVVKPSRITLAFGADGKVSGTASCNRYGAQYTLTGESLTIVRSYATRMACDAPLMDQERAFLEVLDKVHRFEMGPDATLILHTADRRTVTARQASR
jgi:heat shock protein HslJ/uncharacterized lipoprotein YbaY